MRNSFLFLVSLVTLVGCEEDATSAGDCKSGACTSDRFETNELALDATVKWVSGASGTASVRASVVFPLNNREAAIIELSEGDALFASSGGTEIPLILVNPDYGDYEGTFPAGVVTPGSEVTVSFRRASGVSATSSVVRLPAGAPVIESPQPGASFSRATDTIEFRAQASDPTDSIYYSGDGCGTSFSGGFPDSTTPGLFATTIDSTSFAGQTGSCSLELNVNNCIDGTADSAFQTTSEVWAATIRGCVIATVTVESRP